MIRTAVGSLKRNALTLCLALFMAAPSLAADMTELEASFRDFMGTYIREIRSGNKEFVGTVHPNLPEEARGFFIGVTLDMMKHADDEGLQPEITCREYDICKATWPQPGDSWAAQTFIRHEGQWRWLEY